MSGPDSNIALAEWLRSDHVLLFLPECPDELPAFITNAGFNPVDVDLTGVESKTDLMQAMRDALDLDAWFGANWDALNDALYGPEDPEASTAVLILRRPEHGFRLSNEDFQTLLEIISEVAESDRSALRGALVVGREPPTTPNPDS